MVDTNKLRCRIAASGIKKTYLANQLGISRAALSLKLSSTNKFNSDELLVLKRTLRLEDDDFLDIFFADDVEDSSTVGASNG